MSKKKEFKYLHNDIVAKYIFGTLENKRFTQKLLELLLNKHSGSLSDLKILNSVKFIPNNIKIKKMESDILISIPSIKTKVILEVQNILNINTLTKNIVYLFNQIPKEYRSGEKEFTNTDNIIEINLVKHICENLKNIEDTYYLTGIKKKKRLLKNLIKIMIINIEKEDVECYNKDINELRMWLLLIDADTQEKLNNIMVCSKNYPLIREAIEEMKKFNEENLYGNDYWLNDVLYRSELKREYNEGKLNGFNERNYEIAKNLIVNTNTSLEDISKCTELPLKEIKKLQKSLK